MIVTATTRIPMPAHGCNRMWADGRRFFAGLLDGARLSSDDRLNIRAKARRHARQYVAESLPGFTASFRRVRHAPEGRRGRTAWRADGTEALLPIAEILR